MALESVKGYIRSRLLVLGFAEWCDGFNNENIPGTLLDNSWHLEFGRGQNAVQNQQPLQVRWPFILRIYKANTRDPRTLIDDMIVSMDAIIVDLLTASNRLAYAGGALKNLSLDSFRIEPLAESNDNGVIGIMEFSALIIMAID